jgi:hypothetical protein
MHRLHVVAVVRQALLHQLPLLQPVVLVVSLPLPLKQVVADLPQAVTFQPVPPVQSLPPAVVAAVEAHRCQFHQWVVVAVDHHQVVAAVVLAHRLRFAPVAAADVPDPQVLVLV